MIENTVFTICVFFILVRKFMKGALLFFNFNPGNKVLYLASIIWYSTLVLEYVWKHPDSGYGEDEDTEFPMWEDMDRLYHLEVERNFPGKEYDQAYESPAQEPGADTSLDQERTVQRK